MKKILNKIMSITASIGIVMPTISCTFNEYSDSVRNKVINEFANETSNVVKSLILSNQYGFETKQTINDMFSQNSIPGINNNDNIPFNNINDFEKAWGVKENSTDTYKINSNFNLNHFFVADKKSSSTNQINQYKNANTILQDLNYASAIGVINNPLAYNFLNPNQATGGIKNTIIDFFKNAQTLSKSDTSNTNNTIATLLKNSILGPDWTNPSTSAFQNQIINPLKDALNYFVYGQWGTDNNGNPEYTPRNSSELESFISNWKDFDGNNISVFTKNGTPWDKFQPDSTKWYPKDYNFYRTGAYLNYFFFKIQADNSDDSSLGTGGYLTDIINNGIFDPTGMLATIESFFPYLLKNPYYILILVQSIMPLIKYFIFDTNPQNSIKYLTFGNKFPTNQKNSEYNIGDIINNISNFFANKNWVNKIIDFLNEITGLKEPNKLDYIPPFLNDIFLPSNINSLLTILAVFTGKSINDLITWIDSYIKDLFIDANGNYTSLSNTIIQVVDSIHSIYNNWIKQYNDKNDGIKIDLPKLMNFLFNDNSGILILLNKDVSTVLYTVFTQTATPFNETNYNNLLEGLGIQLPPVAGQNPPNNFKDNSILTNLISGFNDSSNPLRDLINVIIGESNKGYQGMNVYAINFDNDYINNNYLKYFDINNTSIGKISKASMKTINKDGTTTNNLQYDLTYTINNKTFKLFIKCTSSFTTGSTPATQNFKFSEINFIK